MSSRAAQKGYCVAFDRGAWVDRLLGEGRVYVARKRGQRHRPRERDFWRVHTIAKAVHPHVAYVCGSNNA